MQYEPFQLPEINGTDDAPSDPRQKALRDLFVSEYLVDYDQIASALRCGFGIEMAREYGVRFMQEPYVQRRIKELQYVKYDESADTDFNQARIKARLLHEAHYYGPGATQSARVAALSTLAKMYGMEKPKTPAGAASVGGVMQVPGISSIDDWEAAAVDSQTQLISDARK